MTPLDLTPLLAAKRDHGKISPLTTWTAYDAAFDRLVAILRDGNPLEDGESLRLYDTIGKAVYRAAWRVATGKDAPRVTFPVCEHRRERGGCA